MKRYKVKFLTEVLNQKLWGIWDEKKKDFVRDNYNLIIASLSKGHLNKLKNKLCLKNVHTKT